MVLGVGSQFRCGAKLGTFCITLADLWQSDRDGLQGAFLQPIASLLARKATPQTARARLITDRRELCRRSLCTRRAGRRLGEFVL
jgi:hypothetical protein